jgi:O-antigen/teichoic acid export membrane protein
LRIGRDAFVNLIGFAVPLAAAVFAIPPLLHSLGAARFGVLTLIWAIVSFFGVFDLGLGRVITQRLAVDLSLPKAAQAGELVATSLLLMLVLGLIGGLLLATAGATYIQLVPSIPDTGEATWSMYAMAAAMPAIVVTSGLRGILEARHAFVAVNAIRVPLGLFSYLGPLAVAWWYEPRLDVIAWVLAIARWLACAAHGALAWRELAPRRTRYRFDTTLVKPLLSDGGWLTVSNLISPLMGYVDRFLIGASVSAVAVAHYTTPLEVAIKLSIVPASVTAVLFPMLAVQMARPGGNVSALMSIGRRVILGVLWPCCVGLAVFADELLSLWIDPGFAASSAPLLRLFAIGILANSIAHLPLTLMQSAGDMRTVAVIHLVEMPLFIALLVPLVWALGAWGAAMAWVLRMSGDAVLMHWQASRHLDSCRTATIDASPLWGTTLILAGFAGMAIDTPAARLLWVAGVAGASALWLLRPAVVDLHAHESASSPAALAQNHRERKT